MIRKILIGASAVLLSFGMLVAVQPPTFHVERSVTVQAPLQNAHALVNDLRAWRTWSPFENKDPNMHRTYSAVSAGVGASYAWAGNSEIGEGRMTIEKSEPSAVTMRLEFIKPFAATNTATFTFTPSNAGTRVTWAMDGENTLVGKIAHLVFDMDKALGGEFERGLGSLKKAAEGRTDTRVEASNLVK